MKLRSFILSLPVCGAALIVGCNRSPSATRVAGDPASTQPIMVPAVVDHGSSPNNVVTSPGQQAAETAEPLGSSVVIDRHQYWFGPAMLRLSKSDGKVVARLYSNDPRGALTGAETADSYDFMMELPDIDDPANIAQAEWSFKSPSSERQDSLNGICLNKEQRLLQPMDVQVRFNGQAPHVQVEIQGVFWMYHTGDEVPTPPATMVRVAGVLDATVPTK